MEHVAAPPYDVISPAEQEALYTRDPHNIVKVEFGKTDPSDNQEQNQYARARTYWEDWIKESVIQKDETKSFYLLSDVFEDPETKVKRTRLVLFGLIKLEAFEKRVVLAHEKTHARAKEDRLKLLQATKTNFSPVFGLYQDNMRLAASLYGRHSKQNPLFSFSLENGEELKLWQIQDVNETRDLTHMFESKPILIADGHHRYETALHYRDLLREHGKNVSHDSDYALMGFVEVEDPGLLILPIHRMIKNLWKFTPREFLTAAQEFFTVERVTDGDLQAISRGDKRGIGVRFLDGSYLFKLQNFKAARQIMPAGKPEIWYGLEVAQIAFLMLKQLGVTEHSMEDHVEYTREAEEAIQKVKSGKANIAFIVPPISAKVMREICLAGELMPQKSTYFYPKLASGLLMYRHE